MDYELTREVLAAHERQRVRYVIIGAVALNLQGLARATLDLDVFIAPEGENIDRLKAALKTVFDDPDVDEITTHLSSIWPPTVAHGIAQIGVQP